MLTTLATIWLAFVVGCGEQAPPPPAPEAPVEEARQVAAEDTAEPRQLLPDTPLPTSHGLYVVGENGALRTIDRGAEDAIHPTNADRGFGFEVPRGVVLNESRPLFVLWTGSLELSTLRLTRFDPETLLPDRWWVDAGAGRVAWLPNATLPLDTERVPNRAGTVRLRPVDPLPPGFYVLHDGTVVGGVRRSEVHTYFPFQVIPGSEVARDPWLPLLTACLSDIEQTVVDSHATEHSGEQLKARLDRATFSRTQAGRLRHCAGQLHAARATTRDEGNRAAITAGLLTLDTVANGPPWDAQAELAAALAPEIGTSGLLEYWLESSALDLAVEAGRAAAADDGVGLAGTMERLATLYGLPAGQGATAPGSLIWVPFYLDPAWPRLHELSGRLAAGLDPFEEVALLLAAHRAYRLTTFPIRHPGSSLRNTVGAVVAGLPAEVGSAMEGLDLARGSNTTVQFGPMHVVSNVAMDDLVVGSVERWIRGRRKPLARCHERLTRRFGGGAPGLVLVRVRLVSSYLGSATSLTVEWPRTGDGARIQSGDDSFLSCLEEEALSGLPADLAQTDAVLTMPVVFFDARAVDMSIR